MGGGGEWKNNRQVRDAVLATIPEVPGQRETCIFELARRLLGIYGRATDPVTLIPILDEWWKRSKSVVGTKDYGSSLRAFLRGYKNAHTAWGETMSDFLRMATEAPAPTWVPPGCDPRQVVLASLCRELQRSAGNDPFYLSSHIAGELLGVAPMTAWRWLDLFVLLRALEVVERGKPGGKKATRYRYLASDLSYRV